MEGKIILWDNKFTEFMYCFESDYEFGYCISISPKLIGKSFDSLINDSNDIVKSIKFQIQLSEIDDDENSEEMISFFKDCITKKEELLLNAEYVEFYHDIDSIINYICSNPILKTKKIIINDYLGLDIEKLNKIYNSLNGEVDNLYFNLSENSKLITFNQCMDTYIMLEILTQEVEKFNFSPLERIMYVYDIVRSRIYVDTDNTNEKFMSRDLSSSLLGNKIVCLGYARIFNVLLEKVGIKTREVCLFEKNGKSGHARNEIYVKDEKYGVDGVYYFDATWDSKKSENDNNYLSLYRYFAKTKVEMDKLDDCKYVDSCIPYFSVDVMWELSDIIKKDGFNNIPQDMIKSINYMSQLVNGKYLINGLVLYRVSHFQEKVDIDDIVTKLMEIVDYFDRPLDAGLLLNVLYNVRKCQYYVNPQKYQFSLEEFYKTVILSGWCFDGSPEEKLLARILNNNSVIDTRRNMIKYENQNHLSKKINCVKLTRTLRKVYESRLNK